jgi:hypothetical protein
MLWRTSSRSNLSSAAGTSQCQMHTLKLTTTKPIRLPSRVRSTSIALSTFLPNCLTRSCHYFLCSWFHRRSRCTRWLIKIRRSRFRVGDWFVLCPCRCRGWRWCSFGLIREALRTWYGRDILIIPYVIILYVYVLHAGYILSSLNCCRAKLDSCASRLAIGVSSRCG